MFVESVSCMFHSRCFDRAYRGLEFEMEIGVCLTDFEIILLLTLCVFNFNLWIWLRLVVGGGYESLIVDTFDVIVIVIVIVRCRTEVQVTCNFLFSQNRLLHLRSTARLAKYYIVCRTVRRFLWKESLKFGRIVRIGHDRWPEIIGCSRWSRCFELFFLTLIWCENLSRTGHWINIVKWLRSIWRQFDRWLIESV